MRDLNYQLKQLCRRNRDGSFATRRDRERLLTLMANQLYELGYRRMFTTSLKPKHVEALVKRWQAEELSIGTIKNRMAALRWWAEKVGRETAIAADNGPYGIADRQYVGTESKARQVSADALDRIGDAHVRMSVDLQQAFGLRREEAIKFQPKFADRVDHIRLKPSWTKGGKARTVPLRTHAQRALLDRAHQLAGHGSMIPADRSYRRQVRLYERQIANAGLSRLHGLRHAYAQSLYERLTGWKPPVAGGPSARALSPKQRARDRQARLAISRELGHEREQISKVYLGA